VIKLSKTKEYLENTDYLKNLGFNINSKGFIIWNTALMLYTKGKTMLPKYTIKDLYKELAELYFVSPRNIENMMTTALKPAKENIQKEYNFNGKITNKSFLNLYYIEG
jgi:hypothetical protein